MKKLAIAMGTLCTALAPVAFGQYDGDRYRDTARVIETRPVYDSVASRQECWNPRAGHYEELRAPERTNVGKGAAIGAVILVLVPWALADAWLWTRGKALDLTVSPPAAAVLRVLAVATVLGNWLYLVLAGR